MWVFKGSDELLLPCVVLNEILNIGMKACFMMNYFVFVWFGTSFVVLGRFTKFCCPMGGWCCFDVAWVEIVMLMDFSFYCSAVVLQRAISP